MECNRSTKKVINLTTFQNFVFDDFPAGHSVYIVHPNFTTGMIKLFIKFYLRNYQNKLIFYPNFVFFENCYQIVANKNFCVLQSLLRLRSLKDLDAPMLILTLINDIDF